MSKSTEHTSPVDRIHDAQEALEKAQQALERARKGLSAVESVAVKAESVRRHPVKTGAIVLLIISAVTLIVAALQSSDE